jgi:polyhydroxybutyrate depolymerase
LKNKVHLESQGQLKLVFRKLPAIAGKICHLTLSALFFALLGLSVAQASTKASAGSIRVDGVKRTYLLHVPAAHDTNKPAPLLIALHGGLGNGKRMIQLTQGGFNALSDEQGFLVVYPEGIHKHWNDGRDGKETGYYAHKKKINDVAFISALIDLLAEQWNVDTNRVFVTGISNGACMSHRLACELSDKVTAIAAVSGSMPQRIFASCRPSSPVSVLTIYNDKDRLMPFEGGNVTGPFGGRKLGKVLSASETMAFWSEQNGCNQLPVVTREPDADINDGTQVRKENYTNCGKGTQVIHYVIENGGHTWPGGDQYLGEWLVGKTSRDMDANKVIWDFFKNIKN